MPWRRLISKLRDARRHTVRLEPGDVEVVWVGEDGSPLGSFRWDELEEIETFKRDLGTYDTICLAFVASGRRYEFCEEDAGFFDLADKMRARFPAISENWYSTVMKPAFATNQRTLWRRG